MFHVFKVAAEGERRKQQGRGRGGISDRVISENLPKVTAIPVVEAWLV